MNVLPMPLEFPIHALPLVAKNSALELQRNTGAPLGLIAASTMTAMSLAMQGLINVKRMEGLEGPVSTWYLIIAESGERKTATDGKNLKPIRDFDAEQSERYEKEIKEYNAAMQAWQVEQKAILAAIKKCVGEEHEEAGEEHEEL